MAPRRSGSGYRAMNAGPTRRGRRGDRRRRIVTTAVGARILEFVAPVIAKGLAARTRLRPLVVIACENAIGGTDLLAVQVRKRLPADNAVFANCAIDRIVPEQSGGLDVTIESFFEWVVDRTPFGGTNPDIYGVTWVDDLEPFIERKLFTVNTAHAAAAYHGLTAAGSRSARPSRPPSCRPRCARCSPRPRNCSSPSTASSREQQAYIEKTLKRISNPQLPDTCERVGRSPLRKLSRHERFIGPAAELAERGLEVWNLLNAVGAALRFDVEEDAESVELQALLAGGGSADAMAETITGLERRASAFEHVVEVVELRLAR